MFSVTEEERSVTAPEDTDLLLQPHSGVLVPFRSVLGEIRLWTDSWTEPAFSVVSDFTAFFSEHVFIWYDVRGILDEEDLFVVSVFSSLLVLDFSFFFSVVTFPITGLTVDGVYEKKTRDNQQLLIYHPFLCCMLNSPVPSYFHSLGRCIFKSKFAA